MQFKAGESGGEKKLIDSRDDGVMVWWCSSVIVWAVKFTYKEVKVNSN